MSDTTTTTTATTSTAATTAAPTTTPSWTSSLSPEMQSYVSTKGFKEPSDVVESYKNFEKLQGVPKERILQLPESLEGEPMNPIWERLGAVKEAKEYKIDVPKEIVDEKFSDFLKDSFHKLKVPRTMAEGFAKAFVEREQAKLTELKAQNDLKIQQELTSIKKEWGAAYEKNESIANQAAIKFGLSKDQIAALGHSMGPANAMKFLHKLGEGIGEAPFHAGGKDTSGAVTPEQAKHEIKQLMSDTDFSRRLSAKDTDAVNRWNRLHQYASPGEISI